MYLTRLELNPARREARRLLANPQVLHAVIMKACDPGDGERILWRGDDADGSVTVYIVSGGVPETAGLVADAGWPEGAAQSAVYEGFLGQLRQGQRYAFRLTANPTHTVTRGGVKKRTAHVTAQHQLGWLLAKAPGCGLKVCSTNLPDPLRHGEPALDLIVRDRMTRSFRRQGKTVTLAMATFVGTLEVTDAARLREALTAGIGPGKAYGCGLLTLARAG